MKKTRGALVVASILPLAVLAVGTSYGNDRDPSSMNGLAALVRAATAEYRDAEYAIAMGYEPGPCVSGPNGGAMGVHFVKPALLDDAPPTVDEPEALIYQPMPNGGFRLVGVEYITFAGPAALEGHLFHYAGSPNRYGLEPFYQLHVWAWKENPDGTFADWNPNVSCDALVPPPM